jgi:uncharacterized protein YprB with RNaseH-like and TPR domain
MRKKTDKPIRSCSFDIETTNLNADFGVVLCGVVIEHDSKAEPDIFRLDELSDEWDQRRSYDRPCIKPLVDKLREFDLICAHNGARFDVPFLRTRLARWKQPTLRDIKILDPCLLARQKFKFSWNSLDKIAEFLGVSSKTPVRGETWIRAALDGDRKAMNYIVEHCVEDVKTLNRIISAMKDYSTAFNSFGSAR